MNLPDILEKINYEGSQEPTYDVLVNLMERWCAEIPFSTMHLRLNGDYEYSEEDFYRRIITDGVGGICNEQHSVFSIVLNEFGYTYSHHAMKPNGETNWNEYCVLVVEIDEEKYLVNLACRHHKVNFPIKLKGGLQENRVPVEGLEDGNYKVTSQRRGGGYQVIDMSKTVDWKWLKESWDNEVSRQEDSDHKVVVDEYVSIIDPFLKFYYKGRFFRCMNAGELKYNGDL